MKQKRTKTVGAHLTVGERKRLYRWEIPHLICALRVRHRVSAVHLPASLPVGKKPCGLMLGDGRTGFPLFVEGRSLGMLICSGALGYREVLEVRKFIDSYMREAVLKLRVAPVKHRPVLLKGKKREEFLRLAHELYLGTRAFAFLTAEDLSWEEGVFRKIGGVFVCVPSFSALSLRQKKILMRDLLQKKLPCHLALGAHSEESLPPGLEDLFSVVL